MFLDSQGFQCYHNYIGAIKNERYFVLKSAPNQAHITGFLEKDTFDSDYDAKFVKYLTNSHF